MTAGTLILAMGSLAVAALVWCFIGFTRALHESPKPQGLRVDMPRLHSPQTIKTPHPVPRPRGSVVEITSKFSNAEEKYSAHGTRGNREDQRRSSATQGLSKG